METKGGWQFPSPDEGWMRGYPQEMEDFVDAVREGREPLSGLLLAHETVEVIYGATCRHKREGGWSCPDRAAREWGEDRDRYPNFGTRDLLLREEA